MYLIPFLIISVVFVNAQNPTVREYTDSLCKAIDKNIQLKKKLYNQEIFMEQVTDEGGELTVYHEDNLVYRIKEWIGLSNAVIIRNYYFKNNKLLFVREEEYLYEVDDAGNINKEKLSRKPGFVGKYYFRKGKIIDEESLGHNRFEDEKNDAEKEYLGLAKKYLNLFYKQ
jgi:hypothetical protein